MKEKGFTLVELLVVILIIALLGGIGIISYNAFFKTSKDKYYNALESDILLAGNDYFLDHRSELPVDSEYKELSLEDLISTKYMEEVRDSKGNSCTGTVYAYRENNKNNYQVCLICSDYESKDNNSFCSQQNAINITITAKTKNTNKDYNVLASYTNTEYAKDENVLVTFDILSNKVEVSRYDIINNKTNERKICDELTGNKCTKEIDKSGTYKIIAYNKENQVVATKKYINVKIAKDGPEFTISGEVKYIISKKECSNNNTTAKVKFTIEPGNTNYEYKEVKYRFNGGEYKSLNTLVINEELESGHYELEVSITDYANKTSTEKYLFDISYEIDLVYYDNTRETHEVVKGQNYNYLSPLPDSNLKDNQRIRWYKEGTLIQDTTIVENNCTHEIYGKKVAVIPTNSLCKSKEESTYTGNTITLVTQTEGTGYTLSGYNQTNANEDGYEITATLKDDIVWEDNTLGPKTFTCKLYKATPTLTIRAHVPKVAKGDTSYHNLKSNVLGTFSTSVSYDSNALGELSVNPECRLYVLNTTCFATVDTSLATGYGLVDIIINFVPTDTANYNTTSGTAQMEILKAATVPTASKYCKNLTYNGNNQTLVKTAGTGFYWAEPTTAKKVGTYSVYAELEDGYAWSNWRSYDLVGPLDEAEIECKIKSTSGGSSGGGDDGGDSYNCKWVQTDDTKQCYKVISGVAVNSSCTTAQWGNKTNSNKSAGTCSNNCSGDCSNGDYLLYMVQCVCT